MQLGNAVKASTEPITPMTLYGVDKSNYKDNEEVVNVLQFLQTLDSDNYHGNGIKIDADTIIKFKDIKTLDFKNETKIKTALASLNIDKVFVSEAQAKRNMDNTLSSIDENIYAIDDLKLRKFQNYSKMWFSSMRRNLDTQVNNALDLTGVYAEVANNTLDVLTSANLAEATFEVFKLIITDSIKNNTNSTLLSKSAGTLANVAFGLIKAGNKKVDAEVIAELTNTLVGLGINISDIFGDTLAEQTKQFQYLVDTIALGYKISTSRTVKVIGKLSDAKKEVIGFIPNIMADIGEVLINDANKTISNRISVAEEYLKLYYMNNEDEDATLSYIRNEYNIDFIDFSGEPLSGEGSTLGGNKDVVDLTKEVSGTDILRVVANIKNIQDDLNYQDIIEISRYTTDFVKAFDSYYKKFIETEKDIEDTPIAKFTIPKTKLKPNQSLIANATSSKSFVKSDKTLTYIWSINGIPVQSNTTNTLVYDLSSTPIGEHYVKLTVTDANGNSESVVNYFEVLENLPPVSKFTISKSTATQGDNITFTSNSTDEDGEIKSYEYKSSIDGILSNKSSFTTSSLTVGTHIITLKVMDDLGAIDTTTKKITINESLTYSWVTSPWGDCTGECGTNNGTKNRTVLCKDSNGNSVSDDYCTDIKPSLTQSCTISECKEVSNNTAIKNNETWKGKSEITVFGVSCSYGLTLTNIQIKNDNFTADLIIDGSYYYDHWDDYGYEGEDMFWCALDSDNDGEIERINKEKISGQLTSSGAMSLSSYNMKASLTSNNRYDGIWYYGSSKGSFYLIKQ